MADPNTNLSLLPAAGALGAGDLLLVRQGTADKATTVSGIETYMNALYKQLGADETSNVADATTSAKGKVELATVAEALLGSDAVRALTAATSHNKNLIANGGHYQLPGGLTLQWGQATLVGSNATVDVTLPLSHTTNLVSFVTANVNAGFDLDGYSYGSFFLTSNSIRIFKHSRDGATTECDWITLGIRTTV